ncbi:MAG: rRNA pseudouridine synthase [Eubacterium sp.]|nr:rRNA pseudouridine synthase [Eubacterium sp.]
MRLDKYLTTMGIGSRSQVKDYIKKGKVKINGEILKKPEYHVDEENDIIEFQGINLEYSKFYYYMLHKPAGYLSAVKDDHCQTVLDLLDVTPKDGLFPVGRLDKDTEGLLLITNDGALSHELLSPKKHVEKKYYVELDGALTESDIQLFQEGVDIGEKHLTKPAKLELLEDNHKAYITITEGKYHQVKRMFKTLGLTVIYLKRLSMGPLELDSTLKPGQFRPLTEKEIKELQCNK